MKAVLISDLHLHHVPESRAIWNASFIEQILDLYSRDYMLFLLGDIIDKRDMVSATVIYQIEKLCLEWAHNNRVVIIAGQHCSYKQGVSTFKGLKHAKNINIIDDKEWNLPNSNIWFVPFYREDNADGKFNYYREMLDRVPDNAVVMTHVTLREAMPDIWTTGKDMIELNDFNRFRQVYSGDIHSGKEWKKAGNDGANFLYCGIPSQRDMRDSGAMTSYYLYENGNHEKVLTNAPRFIKVNDVSDIPTGDGIEYIIKIDGSVNIDLPQNVVGVQKMDISKKQLREQLHQNVIGDKVFEHYCNKRGDSEKFGGVEALLAYIEELKKENA